MGTKVRKTHLTKGKITLLCMTIPSVLFILVFSYFPISGWIYSFFDYRIGYKLSKCEFVGLDNFIYAFGDPYIITVILNTLIISILGLLGLPLAGMIAILLSEVRGKKFKKTVQTAITIPNFISWIIIYSIMFSLFSNDGLLTTLVRGLSGNRDSTVTLLTNPGTAKLFMVLTNIWKTVGIIPLFSSRQLRESIPSCMMPRRWMERDVGRRFCISQFRVFCLPLSRF